MSDTVRSKSELQSIFADGQADGSITPQDMRDFVVSTMGSSDSPGTYLDGFYELADKTIDRSAQFNLSSNTTIIGNNARLIPLSETFDMIRAVGAGPDADNWINLSSDAASGSDSITTSSSLVDVAVGDRIGIKSTGSINGTNIKDTRLYQIRTVKSISSTTYELDKPLDNDFLTSETAQATKVTMVENLVLEDVWLNTPDYTNLMSRGMYFEHCANIVLVRPRIFGTKQRLSSSVLGRNAISFRHCLNIRLYEPQLEGISAYGVALTGACDDFQWIGGGGGDVRHMFDTTWETVTGQSVGEPFRAKIIGVHCDGATDACWSTHENGTDIEFDGISSIGGTYGAIIRNQNCKVSNANFQKASLDGIVTESSAEGFIGNNLVLKYNKRQGLNCGHKAHITNLFSQWNEDSAVSMTHGVLDGGECIENAGGFLEIKNLTINSVDIKEKLFIRNVIAPKPNFDDRQEVAIQIPLNYDARALCEISNCDLSGYLSSSGSNVPKHFDVSSGGSLDNVPYTDGTNITSTQKDFITNTDRVSFEATLSAGSVTIATTSVRNYSGILTIGKLINVLDIKVIEPSNPGHYTWDIKDRSQVVITSSNELDASTILVKIGL